MLGSRCDLGNPPPPIIFHLQTTDVSSLEKMEASEGALWHCTPLRSLSPLEPNLQDYRIMTTGSW